MSREHAVRMLKQREANAASMSEPRRIWDVMGAHDERMVKTRHLEQDLAFFRAMTKARKSGAESVCPGINTAEEGDGRFVRSQPLPAGSLMGSSAGACADS